MESFPAARPVCSEAINQTLQEVVKYELDRLCVHAYRDSISPWASPINTASKVTAPFVRLRGEYVWLNQYAVASQVTS